MGDSKLLKQTQEQNNQPKNYDLDSDIRQNEDRFLNLKKEQSKLKDTDKDYKEKYDALQTEISKQLLILNSLEILKCQDQITDLENFQKSLEKDSKRNQQALSDLKEAHKNQDLDAIDKALNDLNAKWQAASEDIYKSAQAEAQQQGGPKQDAQSGEQEKKGGDDDEVTDVDFEEVK